MTVYALLDDGSRPRSWRIRLSGDEREIDQRLHAGNDFSYPRVLAASDVDLDGDHEWWVKVMDFTSHGAPWGSVNLFVAQDRSLVPLMSEGAPLAINFGGISRLGEGAKCRHGRLVLLRAEAKNPRNTRWKVSERSYRVRDSRARFLSRKEGWLVIDDYNDPDLDPYFEIECFGTKLTPF